MMKLITAAAKYLGVSNGVVIAGLVVLAIGGLGVAKCAYDRSIISAHDQKREVKAGAAREDAADERLTDAETNAKDEQELHDVVDQAPKDGSPLPPSTRALNCERLRKLGRVPPSCGPQGSDGGQASPR